MKSLFELIHGALDHLQRADHPSPPRVVLATRLGGMFGREGSPMLGSPTAAAGVGLLNTLALELPGVLCKAIDFDESDGVEETARHIIDELRFAGGAVEVGYCAGERRVALIERRPLSALDSPELPAEAVILATGGASGITATTLQAMARPGDRLVVVGRTSIVDAEPEALAPLQSVPEVRTWMLQELRATGVDATPAEVETRVRGIMHRRSIRANLAALEATGAEVEYHAVDVSDHPAFHSVHRRGI